MHAPAARDLLNVWERGVHGSATSRGLLLLGAALPEVSDRALLEASIGHRDAWLLNLREELFGRSLECLMPCPKCGEKVEIAFPVEDIRSSHAQPGQVCTLDGGLRFRIPTSADLLAIEAERESANAERRLLSLCQLTGDGECVAHLTAEQAAAASQAMSAADPQAEVLLALTCPTCNETASQLFDISDFLWLELDHWARGMLEKVHLLASHYGWSEDEVVNLSPTRRQVYMQLIGAV